VCAGILDTSAYLFGNLGPAAKGIVFLNVVFCYEVLVVECCIVSFGSGFTCSYNLWLWEAVFSWRAEAMVILMCVYSVTAYAGKLCSSYRR
jgi:hypothetical protein